jgi:hypothetical protein
LKKAVVFLEKKKRCLFEKTGSFMWSQNQLKPMKNSYVGEILLKPKQKLYVVVKNTIKPMKNTYMGRWVSYKVKQLSPKTTLFGPSSAPASHN